MNGKKRKKYLVTVNSEAFACSLVTSPAVEETFVAFNEEKPLIEKFADDKKHMVTGVVAIPNRPIYRRNEDGEEYDIVFSAEAIETMAKDFMKNYRQHEVTLQHQENADGVYLVEQWIKHDMYRDKSAVIGLSEDLPVGSWIQTYYVDSNDVWQRIESGELRGFSLECMLGLEEFNKQIEENKIENNTNMTDNEMLSKIKEMFNEFVASLSMRKKEEEVALETQEPTQEPVVEPAATEPTNEPTVEPTTEPTPTVVEPVVEPAAEPTQEPTEPKAAEEPKEPKATEDEHLSELIKNLKDEIAALKEMNSNLSERVKELGKEPSVKPISTNAKPSASDNLDSFLNWRLKMN